MTLEADTFYMGLALDLAERARGQTTPNPLVGCVIAKGGRILGRGWHRQAGGPHAEVFALLEAGEEARGADLYVTLEPCSHTGRTPPCADAVIKAGVRRVVVALSDPNPLVAGQGLKKLQEAGIEVEAGLLGSRAALQNEAFLHSIRFKRPFVHLKLAATLDGRTAAASGDSKWITSETARERVHLLRKAAGVVMVGVNTANGDDPLLNVRLPGQEVSPTVRVVVDPTLRSLPSLKMFQPGEAKWTILACGPSADSDKVKYFEGLGVKVIKVDELSPGNLDLKPLLETLYQAGFMEVLAEGGAGLAGSLFTLRLVERCHFFYSPKVLGGADAVPMVGGKSPELISGAVELSDVVVDRAGPDIYVTGRTVWKDAEACSCSPA